MNNLVIKGGMVYLDGTFKRTDILVGDGVIQALGTDISNVKEQFDASGLFIIPGLIDPHVHFDMNAGFTRSADNFQTGSEAAIMGGITTVIDFLDEASCAKDVHERLKERTSIVHNIAVDYSFHAAVKELHEEADVVTKTARSLGMPTIKLYTTYKEADSYSPPETVEAMIKSSSSGDILILCHSENDHMLDLQTTDIACHGKNRPPSSEIAAVLEIASYVDRHDGYAYIVHVSCGSTIDNLRQQYGDLLGKRLFLESCPHYFVFDDAKYNSEDSCLYTMTPPLRPRYEKERLATNFDRIDTLATDHCPFMKHEKDKLSLHEIPMGIGGVEQSFKVMHKLYGDEIIDRFTVNTARLHGLYPRKGVIRPGSDADLLFFEKTDDRPIGIGHSKCDYDLFANCVTDIRVDSVMLRGSFVVRHNELIEIRGMFLKRKIDPMLHARS